MPTASDIIARSAIKSQCSVLPPREKIFTAADWARARWPRKTAAHWAAKAGKTERAAKYWLAGEPSGEAVAALMIQMAEDLRS